MKRTAMILLIIMFIWVGCSSVSISKIQQSGDLAGTVVLKDGKKITFDKAFVGIDGKIVRINNETIHQTILMENITSITLGKSKK